ncbi:MAG: phosphoglucomutase/phosphomannomutase family protein [Nitrospirae bacterium]|nr:phosphoglucomutase/phosphomannomutase family protein [Nitrospirota bacterium]
MGGADVQFGTDGWRGIIADNFTFERVDRVARAITRFLLQEKKSRPAPVGGSKPAAARPSHPGAVVIGYDTRFQSDRFAECAAQAAAATGAKVLLADRFVTTPMVSLAVKRLGAAGGIVVTASHNPPIYNGLKVKASYGGPAIGNMIQKIELNYARMPKRPPTKPGVAPIKLIDLTNVYADYLNEVIQWEPIKKLSLRLAVDYMYGAGQRYFSRFVQGHVSEVIELRADCNPGFNGVAPEPLEHKLETLKKTVVEHRLDAGFAFDGDADRIAAVDDLGRYVDSHRIFALLLEYLWNHKKIRGKVGKTFSSTSMVDKIAKKLGATVKETPIGFKHICEQMLKDDVFIGGEESGGVGMKHHMMERDGFFCALLLLEYSAISGRKLSQLVDDLHNRFGPHHFTREDVHWQKLTVPRERLYASLKKKLGTQIAGRKIERMDDMDGLKVFFDNGDWLLFRFSGTEPTLRIYAEMSQPSQLTESIAQAKVIVAKL